MVDYLKDSYKDEEDMKMYCRGDVGVKLDVSTKLQRKFFENQLKTVQAMKSHGMEIADFSNYLKKSLAKKNQFFHNDAFNN